VAGRGDRADAEFKDGSTPSQIREEVHRRLNDFRIKQMWPQCLVPLRDPSIEVVLGHAGQSDQGRSKPASEFRDGTADDVRSGVLGRVPIG